MAACAPEQGDVVPEPVAEPAAELSEAAEPEPTAVVVDDEVAQASAEAVTPTEIPSLVPMMQGIGFASGEDVDLAEFVHAPPAARAEAGSFGDGAEQVRVALIVYPNPRYAEPHFNDVRERVAVIPGSGEAVLMHGVSVIHLRAVDRDTAVRVRDRLAVSLGWEIPESEAQP